MKVRLLERLASTPIVRNLRALQQALRLRSVRSRAPLDLSRLSSMSSEIVAQWMVSREIEEEWRRARQMLDRVCQIRDSLTDGVNPGDRRALYHLVRGLRPSSVLEIGTHVGASTAHLALALAEEEAYLTTVDIEDVNGSEAAWARAGLRRSPRQMVEDLGRGERTRFVRADSLQFLEACTDRFDLVFLDGDHAAPRVYREVPLALERLHPGGTILLHDYYPGRRAFPGAGGSVEVGPVLAVERLCRENPELSVLALGELPWPTKGSSRWTSLALLSSVLD